jgi:hypothetical protein
MHIRGRVLTPLVVGAIVAASMSTANVSARPQQGQKNQAASKKLDKVQLMEVQAAFNAVEAVRRGTPGPAGYKMTLHSDAMKGFNNKTYVAFTVFIDPEGVVQKNVSGYLRVVSKAADVAPEPRIDPKDPKAAEKAKADEKATADTKKTPPAPFAWEELFYAPVVGPSTPELEAARASLRELQQKIPTSAPDVERAKQAVADLESKTPKQPFRLSRSFTVAPGEYNVYLAIRDQADPKAKEKDILAAKAGVLMQSVVVPDYWNNELATSSVVVTDTVTILTAPLAPEEQSAHPYAFGLQELKPLVEQKLSKKSELTAWFFVYNPAADADRKPNVLIEYKFYQKVASAENGEKYFNATAPVELNAKTLPPQFDMAAGHQLPGGLAVPLASFAEGVYRLEIKVTDKISGKSIVKDVTFSVTP